MESLQNDRQERQRIFDASLPEIIAQLHLVGQSKGHVGQSHLLGWFLGSR